MNNSVLEKLLPCEGFMCADGYIVIELVRWLSLGTVSDHLAWAVSTIHLGHGPFSIHYHPDAGKISRLAATASLHSFRPLGEGAEGGTSGTLAGFECSVEPIQSGVTLCC